MKYNVYELDGRLIAAPDNATADKYAGESCRPRPDLTPAHASEAVPAYFDCLDDMPDIVAWEELGRPRLLLKVETTPDGLTVYEDHAYCDLAVKTADGVLHTGAHHVLLPDALILDPGYYGATKRVWR